jgi:hypothetical protein
MCKINDFMRSLLVFTLLLLCSFSTIAQIELSAANTEEKKSVEHSVTRFYLASNWSKTGRKLTENKGFFGDSLGERANEEALNTWSFGLGIRSDFGKHFFWDGGLTFYRNGEQYSFDDADSDSSFNYQTTYSYVSMPLKANAFIGNTIRLYVGAGIVPQMFFGYRQEQQWTTAENSEYTEEIKFKSGYNSFVVSGLLNVGVELLFQSKWSLFVSSEGRWQLTSSYLSQDSYIHKAHAYGISFGLMREL